MHCKSYLYKLLENFREKGLRWWIINSLLGLVWLISGIVSNVSGTMMGYVMPAFPIFLLVITTIAYSSMFLVVALARGERPFSADHTTRTKFRQYLWLALWTTGNGVFFQFSNVWVDPDLQQLLLNLQIPFTFILARIILPNVTYNKREIMGTVIVMGGIAVGLAPTIQHFSQEPNNAPQQQGNSWYWVLGFASSLVFASGEIVWQERVFHDPHNCIEATTLFWYNLMSLVGYLLIIPFEAVPYLNGKTHRETLAYAFENQLHGFLCFINSPSEVDVEQDNCLPLGWMWVTLFVVGYSWKFLLNASLVNRYNAVFVLILGSLVQPISVLPFAWEKVVGAANYQPVNMWIFLSFVVIIVGVGVKGTPISTQTKPKISNGRGYVELHENVDSTTTTNPSTISLQVWDNSPSVN